MEGKIIQIIGISETLYALDDNGNVYRLFSDKSCGIRDNWDKIENIVRKQNY